MGLMTIDPGENVPLWVDEENELIRIRGTRLKLETVMWQYYRGLTRPEEIVYSFDTLTVGMVERILDWYHTRREEVNAYMKWTLERDAAVRARYEPLFEEVRRRKEEDRRHRSQAHPV
ncbi:MAG: DUF433 domain-containing protein [Acidimicrobiia bacterium]|nr:DUF433 domain-containing protein [Acidimicrobiia bacterium]MYH05072.1 DUF433 domain-containing protein [Acidimicrobiia bacterium]